MWRMNFLLTVLGLALNLIRFSFLTRVANCRFGISRNGNQNQCKPKKFQAEQSTVKLIHETYPQSRQVVITILTLAVRPHSETDFHCLSCVGWPRGSLTTPCLVFFILRSIHNKRLIKCSFAAICSYAHDTGDGNITHYMSVADETGTLHVLEMPKHLRETTVERVNWVFDPRGRSQSRPVVITIFTHVVRASPLFKIDQNRPSLPAWTGLAEWIIDDSCLL